MKSDAKMVHHKENPDYMKWQVKSIMFKCSGYGETPEDAYQAYKDALNESTAFWGA